MITFAILAAALTIAAAVAVDHDGHTAIEFGVYGAPETFLVNPEGIIVHKLIGPMTPEIWRKDFASRLPARASANP